MNSCFAENRVRTLYSLEKFHIVSFCNGRGAHHWAKPKIKGVLGVSLLLHPFAPDNPKLGLG